MKAACFLLVGIAVFGCTSSDLKEPVEYTGPLREVENLELYSSEGERIKSKVVADLVYEFANGDQEFPKGVYIEMYNEFGRLESTLRANYAKFIKAEEHWMGQGKVELKNVEKNEQLNTEELFYNPKTKKIYTDKFVTIRTQGDVIYGTGLNAMQDLSDYEITNPEGILEVEEWQKAYSKQLTADSLWARLQYLQSVDGSFSRAAYFLKPHNSNAVDQGYFNHERAHPRTSEDKETLH